MEVSVIVVESPPPNGMGVSVVIELGQTSNAEKKFLLERWLQAEARALVLLEQILVAADNGAAAPAADGIRAEAKLGADNEINPLITKVMMNKKVASPLAKRKTGTMRGVGGLTPAICGVKVKLRGARREGS